MPSQSRGYLVMTKTPQSVVEVFLQPGEFYFGDRDTRIRTLLGSCVAITMWHPRLQVGGMCHFMLPSRHGGPSHEPDGRYANEAMLLFDKEIRAIAAKPSDFQVKVFGGGNMFQVPPSCSHESECQHVSCRNVLSGRRLLKESGFNIVAEHVGDFGHRNVIFDVWSGDVWLRHVRNRNLLESAYEPSQGKCIGSR